MFKNFDHFKKATQTVFASLKKDPSFNLSQFRHQICQAAGFSSLPALADSFTSSIGEISVVSIILSCPDGILFKKDFLDIPENKSAIYQCFDATVRENITDREEITDVEIAWAFESGEMMSIHGCIIVSVVRSSV